MVTSQYFAKSIYHNVLIGQSILGKPIGRNVWPRFRGPNLYSTTSSSRRPILNIDFQVVKGGRLGMNCESCQQLLSEFVDDTLSNADSSAVSDHLLACGACCDLHLDLSAIVFSCRGLKFSDESHNRVLRVPFNRGDVC